jgi:hypothetical protein
MCTVSRFLSLILMIVLYGSIGWSTFPRHDQLAVHPAFTKSNDEFEQGFLLKTGRMSQGNTTTCDSGLAIDSSDPVDAAKAIDICKFSTGDSDWGLVSASWVMADGSSQTNDPDYALGHGILSEFGSNVGVIQGEHLLVLSTGTARQPAEPSYQAVDPGFDKGYTGNYPYGHPVATFFCGSACATPGTFHDDAALELIFRTPPNASGFSFDYKYYTTDYPDWVCAQYTDGFIANIIPGFAGNTESNIATPNGLPMNANSDALQVCSTDPETCNLCYYGTTDLVGTGFEGHGATSWVQAIAPVDGDTLITLRLAIYDSGDGAMDATVLIDNFHWLLEPYNTYLPLIIK